MSRKFELKQTSDDPLSNAQLNVGGSQQHFEVFGEPERIVGLGFRFWMRGCLTGDVGCWEWTRCLYTGRFGSFGGRMATDALSTWVRSIEQLSRSLVEVRHTSCSDFCRDECVAVSMISACQHHTCPAMRACAFAMVDGLAVDTVLRDAQVFADVLMGMDTVLSRRSILAAPASVPISHRFAN
jgi:hypothetical protein